MSEHPHDLDVHLATCQQCAAEVAQYRELRHAVSLLREEPEPVPAGLAASVVGRLHSRTLFDRARGLAQDRRVHVAAASLGGAVLGAGAIALILWRSGRRSVPRAA